MRYALDRGSSGSDDTYALVLEFVQASSSITASIVVVPATGVEGVAFEFLDTGNPRQLGLVQWPARHDHKARLEHVAAIGSNRPTPRLIVPTRLLDPGLEAGFLVKMEVLPDPLGMGENLRREGVSFLRDIAGLFQERQIKIALDVALSAG